MTWTEARADAERRMATATPEMATAYAAMVAAMAERERRERR